LEGALRAPRSAHDGGLTVNVLAGRIAPRSRTPLLHGADAARALEIAQRIYAASFARLAQSAGPPESLARYGGAALVAESLVRAGVGDEAQLRTALREALVFAPDRLGLADGAAGLVLVLDAADPERTSFGAVRARLRDALAASLRALPPGDPARFDSYDLLAGPAGRAALLARTSGEPVQALGPFATAFADALEERLASRDPDVAAINLSVSHGAAGILAALNLALPDERAVARRYVELLLRCAHTVGGAHRWGAVWRPGEIPTTRRAWCYQTAGIAAVLADRARIEGDGALHALAAGALAAPEPAETRADFGLCHGRAGIATLASRFAGDERLTRRAESLAREVLDGFDPRAPLGYRVANVRDRRLEDRAGFLDAALGIAQFLIDAATARERRWLTLFGLLAD
jgi:hypothetical protein